MNNATGCGRDAASGRAKVSCATECQGPRAEVKGAPTQGVGRIVRPSLAVGQAECRADGYRALVDGTVRKLVHGDAARTGRTVAQCDRGAAGNSGCARSLESQTIGDLCTADCDSVIGVAAGRARSRDEKEIVSIGRSSAECTGSATGVGVPEITSAPSACGRGTRTGSGGVLIPVELSLGAGDGEQRATN